MTKFFRIRFFALVAVGVAGVASFALASSAAAASPPFNECPAVGEDSSCAVLLVISPEGKLEAFTDGSQKPFDGIEDTLVGVINESRNPVSRIKLTGTDIFLFDGDGICLPYTPGPEGCPFGVEETDPETGAGTGGIYQGPDNTFDIFNLNEGEVVFTTPLQPGGGSTYFSLEEAIEGFSCNETECHAKEPPHPEPCERVVGWGHSGPVGPTGFNEDDELNTTGLGKEQFEYKHPGFHMHLSHLVEPRCETFEGNSTFSGSGPARVSGVKGYYVYFYIEKYEGVIYVFAYVVNKEGEVVDIVEKVMNPKAHQNFS